MLVLTVDDLRELLKKERKRRRLTQSRAAGLVGYSQKWLSDFERGRVNPPIDMVLKMISVLGIRLEASATEPASIADEEAIL
ncbi:helix-turn-helix domain-containing protein (plasmid) [Agrobacterium sp. MA01]|uniref:helix-turn-helix domain-containing protein n=1 Tax=Agrobacterium sp. MA01 TaxID=2664893 RepID=UPI00129A8A00|nr:helix-turn-helix transcriptional regulator [Agrobacterium sp. MA01]QGG93482.1 helix-turn-helix domain-containing protein [Agrobacterium sp. MA01]